MLPGCAPGPLVVDVPGVGPTWVRPVTPVDTWLVFSDEHSPMSAWDALQAGVR